MSAAEIAQRVRKELLSWGDVLAVYGPLLGQPEQFFLRFELNDGTSYAVELVKERGE